MIGVDPDEDYSEGDGELPEPGETADADVVRRRPASHGSDPRGRRDARRRLEDYLDDKRLRERLQDHLADEITGSPGRPK